MAEEKTPAEGADELVLQEEDRLENQEEEQLQADEPAIEALAAEMGWTPKDQFKGDETKWKPASEWIRAGHEIQRNVSQELKSLRSTVDTMERTSASLLADRLAAEKARLAAQFDAAVEDGDSDTARKIAGDMAKLDTSQPKPAVPAESQAWVEKHSAWFNKDPLATELAITTCEKLNKQGFSVPEQLEQAERAVRKQFPELFPQQKGQARTHESRRDAGHRTTKKAFADLPPEAQKVALDMEERLSIPRETYATNFFNNQAASGQPGRA